MLQWSYPLSVALTYKNHMRHCEITIRAKEKRRASVPNNSCVPGAPIESTSPSSNRRQFHALLIPEIGRPERDLGAECPDMLLARFRLHRQKSNRQPLHPLLLNSFAEGGCFIPQFHGQRWMIPQCYSRHAPSADSSFTLTTHFFGCTEQMSRQNE